MKNTFLIILSLIVVVSSLFNWTQYNNMKDMTKDNDSLNVVNKQVNAALKNKSKYADSVATMNTLLFSQKQLTEAMNFRDKSTSTMFKVGDQVRVKLDSSIAYISDVIIGGGKYRFYIEYEVQFKDRHFEKLSPELIEKP